MNSSVRRPNRSNQPSLWKLKNMVRKGGVQCQCGKLFELYGLYMFVARSMCVSLIHFPSYGHCYTYGRSLVTIIATPFGISRHQQGCCWNSGTYIHVFIISIISIYSLDFQSFSHVRMFWTFITIPCSILTPGSLYVQYKQQSYYDNLCHSIHSQNSGKWSTLGDGHQSKPVWPMMGWGSVPSCCNSVVLCMCIFVRIKQFPWHYLEYLD